MISINKLLALIMVAVVLAVVAAFGFIYFGIYNIAATAQHSQVVYDVLETTRKQAINARLKDIEVPDLEQLDYRVSGVQLYEENCLQCHGAPGIAPDTFSLGMMPAPSAAAKIGAVRSPQEIYWVVAYGIKMSGMPGWAFRLTEEEHWQLVSLLTHIPSMSRADYQNLRDQAYTSNEAAGENAHKSDKVSIEDDTSHWSRYTERGKIALIQYNCATCHIIPGITASETHVGPNLRGITRQSFIAGVLPNTGDNLERFIREPDRFKPNTLMPNLKVNKDDAKAMVDYLRALN